MIKSYLIIGIFYLAFSTPAFAWDIGIAKGDDPQFVKDIVEGAKHGGTQIANGAKKAGTEISNGVRDVFSVVGNATGISDVIDSNMETIISAGRAKACLATLCYSEILRKKQLEEAEEKAKKQYELAFQDYVEKSSRADREMRISSAKRAYELAKAYYNQLYERYQIVLSQHKALFSIQQAIFAENEYRKKLEEAGVQGRRLENREMIPPTNEFVQNRSQNYTTAMQKLNQQMEVISAQTGRSREKLLAEFVRILDFPTMKSIINDTNSIGENMLKEKADLKIQLQKAHKELKKQENNYNVELA
ncbi:hypothetical protein AZI86_02050 [Bdellovibrio bacteriovorus]|uniref:Uncharacterized protein n=1 Tax=Bdellovibrio bacteriovorus TaxID=959 RepID=A0A150WNB2_BDEBC|nr:hypothetical protein [Bdellovibrio bacteriovorus]KYG65878.1 hypothetical protein AZI86_02050 [Bdellovibrio bacteriovorus]